MFPFPAFLCVRYVAGFSYPNCVARTARANVPPYVSVVLRNGRYFDSRHSSCSRPIICVDLVLHPTSAFTSCFLPIIMCCERLYPHTPAYLYAPGSYHSCLRNSHISVGLIPPLRTPMCPLVSPVHCFPVIVPCTGSYRAPPPPHIHTHYAPCRTEPVFLSIYVSPHQSTTASAPIICVSHPLRVHIALKFLSPIPYLCKTSTSSR